MLNAIEEGEIATLPCDKEAGIYLVNKVEVAMVVQAIPSDESKYEEVAGYVTERKH